MAKKNFRQIPDRISNKANQLTGNNLIVSSLVTFSAADIRSGKLNHLGITLDNTGLQYPATIIPNTTQGKHSRKNVDGEVVVRRDLPKRTKYYSWEVPNWGDSSNGTHTVNVPREVYRRDFIPPNLVSLNIECRNTDPNLNQYSILFQLDEVLDKNSPDFEDRLLDLINILLENICVCDVNLSTSTYQNYISTMQLAWEILPPGEREAFIQSLSTTNGSANPNSIGIIDQRYQFLLSLNPVNLIVGTSGLQRYSGAMINNNLVVFENIRYGNALYIMYDNWDTLSQRSRTEIISGQYGTSYDRVVHFDGWEDKARQIIRDRLIP